MKSDAASYSAFAARILADYDAEVAFIAAFEALKGKRTVVLAVAPVSHDAPTVRPSK